MPKHMIMTTTTILIDICGIDTTGNTGRMDTVGIGMTGKIPGECTIEERNPSFAFYLQCIFPLFSGTLQLVTDSTYSGLKISA
jgi:hypothetical protein